MNRQKQPYKLASTKSVTTRGRRHILVDSPYREESERVAYFLLGKLSTSFAEMEQELQYLLSYLVMRDTFIGNYLIEKNTLEINLTLLEKANEFEEFEPERVLQLIDLIREVKGHRNTLIHGNWYVSPGLNEEDISVSVTTNKIKYETDKNKEHKSWHNVTDQDYTIQTLKDLIDKVKSINTSLEETLSRLRAYHNDPDKLQEEVDKANLKIKNDKIIKEMQNRNEK
jgi:hypothetical protein